MSLACRYSPGASSGQQLLRGHLFPPFVVGYAPRAGEIFPPGNARAFAQITLALLLAAPIFSVQAELYFNPRFLADDPIFFLNRL